MGQAHRRQPAADQRQHRLSAHAAQSQRPPRYRGHRPSGQRVQRPRLI